jgi:hypothetical protein
MEVELENRERLANLIHERTEPGLRSTTTGGVYYGPSSARLEKIVYIATRDATSDDEDGMGTEDGTTPLPFSRGDHLVFRSDDGRLHHAVVSSIPYVSGTEAFVRGATVVFQNRNKLRARTLEEWTGSIDAPLPLIYKVIYDKGDHEHSFTRLARLLGARPAIPDSEWDDLDLAYYCCTANLIKESKRTNARNAFARAVTDAAATGHIAVFYIGV